MEKVLNQLPQDQQVKAERILEINPDHAVMATMKAAFDKGDAGKDMVTTYSNLLYNQALLISGLTVDDPIKFGEDICKVMTSQVLS